MHKLLFISNQYSPNVVGGAELGVQALAEELLRRGYEVVVASLSPTGKDEVDFVNGIKVYRVALANLYYPFAGKRSPLMRAMYHALDVYNPGMARKVGEILDLERPDTVSTHNLGGFSVAVWGAVKDRKLRLVHTLHDYYLMCPRTTMHRAGHNCQTICTGCRPYALAKRATSHQPDAVIGVSTYVLERHLGEGYFPNVQARAINNGRKHARDEQRSPKNGSQLRLGFIGRVEPVKGIETLLRALTQLPPEGWTLSVAGRAESDSYLEQLKQEFPLPQVQYLGYVDSSSFYATVDLVVVPSEWHEPLGGVVYEPLGFGVPVLASRVGGIPEILEGSGCGWLFEPGDVDGLALRLQSFLNEPPDFIAMGERARVHREKFTPERYADNFLAFVGSVEARSD